MLLARSIYIKQTGDPTGPPVFVLKWGWSVPIRARFSSIFSHPHHILRSAIFGTRLHCKPLCVKAKHLTLSNSRLVPN
ncbi:hypothetical protein DVU_2685 [Nitratidesulfovibrio vulgaris str. Hildenborough]|uniref:Uncharacterized protein n=1 Tax=Nitratidesulfovibrio vulgaris (strain ATCC 29579 / DSM 644 / CCUG 34227 / NCIMB 8303 / VKM B-1760 / Hildenborough) TaxID=882 RepID=Q728B9_NITV2|nr:hypothetical protein DVU_2685 [Nitratidesulfovibrio vulgaris str. Hildenborough]